MPVYYGPDPLGGLGAFGRWNVGNWVRDVQALRQLDAEVLSVRRADHFALHELFYVERQVSR